MADINFQLLTDIQPADSLAEGREKINSIARRVNEGKFDNLFVRGDLNVDGKLFVSEIVSDETTTITTEEAIFTLYDVDEDDARVNDADRGIVFKYAVQDVGVKTGFFGWSGFGNDVGTRAKFKYIPEITNISSGVYSGDKGIIDAKIEASDILNAQNIATVLIGEGNVVTTNTAQTISSNKTFDSGARLVLQATNQGNFTNDAVTAARSFSSTDGILIDGLTSANLTSNRSLSLDSTVVRTTNRDQTILGTKTFAKIITSDVIIGTAEYVVDGVYTNSVDQTILGSKVFRQSENGDGLRLFPQNTGSSDFTLTITTAEALTGNRSLTLANANTTLVSGTMVSTTVNQTIDSEKIFTKNVLFSNSGTEKRGIKGRVGGDDFWFVGGKAESTSFGYAEISTGKDGIEPVYARQYIGSPLTEAPFREFVILSTDGNTEAPGYIKLGQQATTVDQAVRADRQISTGTGLQGGGNLTSNRTISIDSTVITTTGTQTITGVKTFNEKIVGNIDTADRLKTAREINGVPFDGTQNITVSSAIDGIFYESLQVVQRNYTVSTDKNAMAIGPITIPDGIEINISSGSTFTII
jgi:hypothetical protein